MSDFRTEEEPEADILVRIEGRAKHLAHLGQVKTPEILRECGVEITRLRALHEAAKELHADMIIRAETRIDQISGRQYQIVNAGSSAWYDFDRALADLAVPVAEKTP